MNGYNIAYEIYLFRYVTALNNKLYIKMNIGEAILRMKTEDSQMTVQSEIIFFPSI